MLDDWDEDEAEKHQKLEGWATVIIRSPIDDVLRGVHRCYSLRDQQANFHRIHGK